MSDGLKRIRRIVLTEGIPEVVSEVRRAGAGAGAGADEAGQAESGICGGLEEGRIRTR